MGRSRALVAAAVLAAAGLSARPAAQETAVTAQPRPIVRSVSVTGAHQLGEREALDAMHVRVGEPLPQDPDRLATAVARHYQDEGYTFAKATAAFDENTGALGLRIDEGVIDAVEFQGVPEQLARRVEEDFAIRAGDVFNRRRA